MDVNPFKKSDPMKKTILSLAIITLIVFNISAQTGQKALLIIDIQDFYFPGGKSALVDPEKAASNAALLLTNKIDTLVICGMQTHMCVEAATRAASDYGFKCILIHDACATMNLKFGDKTIKAVDVHYSTLSTLKNYALVESTNEYLNKK